MEGLFVSTKVLEYLYSRLISHHKGLPVQGIYNWVSFTTGSCSQMPGASSSALLGDLMLINIQNVVETPGTTGIQSYLPEHRTLPKVMGMVISGIHFTMLCTFVICNDSARTSTVLRFRHLYCRMVGVHCSKHVSMDILI